MLRQTKTLPSPSAGVRVEARTPSEIQPRAFQNDTKSFPKRTHPFPKRHQKFPETTPKVSQNVHTRTLVLFLVLYYGLTLNNEASDEVNL